MILLIIEPSFVVFNIISPSVKDDDLGIRVPVRNADQDLRKKWRILTIKVGTM